MPGHTLDEILAVIDQEIAALKAKPIDEAELDRAKNQIESENVRSLEPLLARAERLQSYNYLLNDPGFLTEDLRRYRMVDAGAVERTAQEVLTKDGRVVVTIEPNPEAPIMGRVKK
jgi:predicted Zn-dependent peptidase